MTEECREMTLAEWVDQLPVSHQARKELEDLKGERDNYRNDALAYLNTISEADDDVQYLRKKLANALWLINHFQSIEESEVTVDVWLLMRAWVADMRCIGIEPSVE